MKGPGMLVISPLCGGYVFIAFKNVNHMISLICGILKNDTNEPTYKTEIDSDIENKGERWEEG